MFVARQWVWVWISAGDSTVSLAVAMGIYLCGCLWFGGYGNFVEIFGFVMVAVDFVGCSGGGGGGDGWLLVVGLSFSVRWLLALVGC